MSQGIAKETVLLRLSQSSRLWKLTICDAVINRKKMDVQIFQTAVREYMSDPYKKLQILVQYADRLGVRDEVMKYVEVMT